jgi:hypothetical protein
LPYPNSEIRQFENAVSLADNNLQRVLSYEKQMDINLTQCQHKRWGLG